MNPCLAAMRALRGFLILLWRLCYNSETLPAERQALRGINHFAKYFTNVRRTFIIVELMFSSQFPTPYGVA